MPSKMDIIHRQYMAVVVVMVVVMMLSVVNHLHCVVMFLLLPLLHRMLGYSCFCSVLVCFSFIHVFFFFSGTFHFLIREFEAIRTNVCKNVYKVFDTLTFGSIPKMWYESKTNERKMKKNKMGLLGSAHIPNARDMKSHEYLKTENRMNRFLSN